MAQSSTFMPPLLDTILFCDDIRQEAGNKLTVVGIYGRHLFLPRDAQFPAGIRQLSIYLRFADVVGGEILRLKVVLGTRIVFEPKEPTLLSVPLHRDEYSSVGLFLVPFAFESFGDYTIQLYWDDEVRPFKEEILTVSPAP
jgi:hypothetical protein